jgi:hypothetical protein
MTLIGYTMMCEQTGPKQPERGGGRDHQGAVGGWRDDSRPN